MQTTDRDRAAAITGLAPEQVRLHNALLGAGFGRRAVPDSHFVSEAVQISHTIQAPVKVYWTREDDIKGGYYRPRSYHLIAAGLADDGLPVAWRHRIVSQSIIQGTPFESAMIHDGIDETSVEGAFDSPYEIPDFLTDYHMAPADVPVLWWRSVGHSFTAYVKECFIDELARAAGKDPYQYRRRLLAEHPRERGVLDLVAEKAGWTKKLPEGRGRGIAVHASFGSYIAQVAEVSVAGNGSIHVHKVTCAIDCGRTVNPDTIRAQMESGIVFGLSAAFYGEITFRNGRVYQSNFDDYEVLRIDAMPEVEVHIVPSEEPPGGVGEPGVPPIAPAVANGVLALTGTPLRRLPLTRERVKKAWQAA
jgi:isoquinoline 1-oxidoreductase beta subunit